MARAEAKVKGVKHMHIDRNTIIGMAVVMVGITIPVPASSQVPANDSVGTLSAPGGRFVFGQISSYRRDQFMLDTQTGRLWQMVCSRTDETDPKKPCLTTVLEPVSYTNQAGSLSQTPLPALTK